MRNGLTHIICLLVLGQFPWHVSMGQDISLSNPVETIAFHTDRSLYISGENICFSATVMTENLARGKTLSKVLYIEIINQNKDQIIEEKFLVSDAVCTGTFEIPRDLSTGVYYIKSYTKYMRNFGPGSFSYHKIWVLNPFEGSVQIEDHDENDQQTGTYMASPYNEKDGFHIETDSEVYKPADSIVIRIIPKIHPDSLKSACMSVVPSHSFDPETMVFNGNRKPVDGPVYAPEYQGITLTGLLLDNDSRLPLPSRQLELSILGYPCDFMAVYTNSAGRFFFPLPEIRGQETVFISTRSIDSITPSILVDNDFSPQSVDMPYQSFILSEDEKTTALNLARNQQIAEQYTPASDTSTNEGEYYGDTAFYGKPTETLNIDDYIQLQTLEDYFNELPYMVKVRKLHAKKYLKISGSNPATQIYEPLVLMDMIAVHDIDAILSVSSRLISHIDIINEPYVKGNITYGGIISIFSRSNDFAGIDLPQSGIFIRYDFLSASMPEAGGNGDPHMPDARNTLFWDGNLQITGDTPQEISFLSGHSKGQYDIVLQGVMQNGERFFQRVTFKVE
jgi:hypothetical protein